MTEDAPLRARLRDYLQALHDNSSPPCLHRYRGIVREREIARRNQREKDALDALMAAVGFNPWRPDPRNPSWSGLCPSGRHGLDFEGQACDLCEKP